MTHLPAQKTFSASELIARQVKVIAARDAEIAQLKATLAEQAEALAQMQQDAELREIEAEEAEPVRGVVGYHAMPLVRDRLTQIPERIARIDALVKRNAGERRIEELKNNRKVA